MNSSKSGLVFGVFFFISIVVVEAVSWLLSNKLPAGTSILKLLLVAGLGSLLAGWLFQKFINLFTKTVSPGLQQDSNEKFHIVGARRSAANHFRGIEVRGGELILKVDMLYFNPHQFNIQQQTVAIALENISKIEKKNYFFGLLDNGIIITLNNGDEEKFVVSNRDQWIAEIKQAKQSLNA